MKKTAEEKVMANKGLKVAFHTLGCKVNQYETKAIADAFASRGYDVVGEEDVADIFVVNTCSVTHIADRKSRQSIRRAKKTSPNAVIVATGCYAQLEADKVSKIPGVSVVVGTNEKQKIVDEVEEYLANREQRLAVLPYDKLDSFVELQEGATTPADRSRAYVKVQEGCDRFCSYCIIPYARGSCRSRNYDNIISEARHLVELGFQEIVLTGINTALCDCLADVISELSSWEERFRIRLSSLEPTVVDADFVSDLLPYKKLCHHLHLSIQSGSDSVIKRMNRNYSSQDYREIVRRLQDFDLLYGITTDIIVGFPGESDEEFEETLALVRDIDFCRVHVFKYSPRSGTAAARMKDQVPEDVKKQRINRLEEASDEARMRFIEANIGTETEVLIEEYDKKLGLAVGYTGNYIRAYIDGSQEDVEHQCGRLINGVIESPYLDGVRVTV